MAVLSSSVLVHVERDRPAPVRREVHRLTARTVARSAGRVRADAIAVDDQLQHVVVRRRRVVAVRPAGRTAVVAVRRTGR